MEVELWPIDRPVPYARNARKIPPPAVDKVAFSIKDIGRLGCCRGPAPPSQHDDREVRDAYQSTNYGAADAVTVSADRQQASSDHAESCRAVGLHASLSLTSAVGRGAIPGPQ